VIPKQGKKPAGRLSALDIAKNTLKTARQKERKIKLSEMKNTLPEPPAGASTARRLQNPDHVDIVKGMMNVPSARDMGLSMEGEEIHNKMMIATTRQLSASTGGQYSRYIARLCKGYRRVEPESYR
jgi:hypothetical protein